jgi:hypothetical protein
MVPKKYEHNEKEKNDEFKEELWELFNIRKIEYY